MVVALARRLRSSNLWIKFMVVAGGFIVLVGFLHPSRHPHPMPIFDEDQYIEDEMLLNEKAFEDAVKQDNAEPMAADRVSPLGGQNLSKTPTSNRLTLSQQREIQQLYGNEIGGQEIVAKSKTAARTVAPIQEPESIEKKKRIFSVNTTNVSSTQTAAKQPTLPSDKEVKSGGEKGPNESIHATQPTQQASGKKQSASSIPQVKPILIKKQLPAKGGSAATESRPDTQKGSKLAKLKGQNSSSKNTTTTTGKASKVTVNQATVVGKLFR